MGCMDKSITADS